MIQSETKPKNVEEAIEAGWKTAKEMYETAGVCRATFENFLKAVRNATLQKPNSCCLSSLVVKLGSAHKAYYHTKVEKAFKLFLKRNAMNAGGQRTEGSIVKQDNQQDLFIGCIATKGTPDEIRSLADHLKNVADHIVRD